ncbi:MAG: aldo/keto reductase [Euzebya sp.]
MTIMTMPRLGLGTWELEGDQATRSVQTGLDMGYRHVDTAQMYQNEAQVGRGIAASGVDRASIWLTTKLAQDNLEPDDVISSTQTSLDRLGVDYLDLLLIHWPTSIDTVEQTLAAMQQLKERDLVRHLGVSNFTAEQVKRAAAAAEITANQVEYHALLDQSAVIEAVRAVDAIVTAYSPLARGRLLRNPVITNIAGARDASPAQVALRWLLDQEGVAAIPKATSEEHLRANLDVLSMPALQGEDTAAIDQLPKDQRVIDPPFAPDWD